MTDGERIARLERRLDRERRARQEAEAIAERVTRDLWVHQQELNDKVARRAREADDARLAAEAALEQRADRLADATHRLRTPLHAVLATLDLLTHEPLDGPSRSLVEQARLGALELRDEVSGVLDESETSGAGFAVRDLIDRHEADWQRQAALAGRLLVVDLAPDLPHWARGSVTEHHQRAQALLGAALAEHRTGSIQLALRAGSDADAGLAIAVGPA